MINFESDSISRSSIFRPCSVCKAPAPERCGNCKAAFYCSKDCQLVDWSSGHGRNCKKAPSWQTTDMTKVRALAFNRLLLLQHHLTLLVSRVTARLFNLDPFRYHKCFRLFFLPRLCLAEMLPPPLLPSFPIVLFKWTRCFRRCDLCFLPRQHNASDVLPCKRVHQRSAFLLSPTHLLPASVQYIHSPSTQMHR